MSSSCHVLPHDSLDDDDDDDDDDDGDDDDGDDDDEDDDRDAFPKSILSNFLGASTDNHL